MKKQDVDLLKAISIKNKKAFDTLYERYIRLAYKFVYYQLQDQELTDDLIQEFWIRVWEDPSFMKCNANGSVQSYMLQYLKFRILDIYRKTYRELLRVDNVEIAEREIAVYNNITEDLSIKELYNIITEALDKQSQVAKNAFWMRIHNWSVEETATALSVSPKTVYNTYSESLSVVRSHIKKHYPELIENLSPTLKNKIYSLRALFL